MSYYAWVKKNVHADENCKQERWKSFSELSPLTFHSKMRTKKLRNKQIGVTVNLQDFDCEQKWLCTRETVYPTLPYLIDVFHFVCVRFPVLQTLPLVCGRRLSGVGGGDSVRHQSFVWPGHQGRAVRMCCVCCTAQWESSRHWGQEGRCVHHRGKCFYSGIKWFDQRLNTIGKNKYAHKNLVSLCSFCSITVWDVT